MVGLLRALRALFRGNAPAALLVAGAALSGGCSGPAEKKDVSYDDRFGVDTTFDALVPAGATHAPAVLVFHGGLFQNGDKKDERPVVERLAGSGYVAVTANYRIAPGAVFPAQVADATCALAFLRAHAADYGLDPARIAVAGHAAGGYLAAMLGVAAGEKDVAPDCAVGSTGPPEAVFASAGVYDLKKMSGKADVQAFVGAKIEDAPAVYDSASPDERVPAGAPPFLLEHGDFDFVVTVDQAKAMQAALLAKGDDVRFLELTDPGHFLAAGADNGGLFAGGVDQRPETWIAFLDFLEETIGRP
jgi:acetyl esterase/lipase